MDLAYQTDTALAELHVQREKADSLRDSVTEDLHYTVDDKMGYRGRSRVWTMSTHEVLEAARALQAVTEADLPARRRESRRHIDGKLARYEELTETISRLNHEIGELDKIHAADPWPRYFPCRTHNEHIHSGYGCSGLKHNSVLMWQPELSGHTVDEAVAKLGPKLCTHCFPNAPVEYTQGEADTSCPGSGKFVRHPRPYHREYGKCPECEYSGQLTQYGYIRRHQPKAA
jgi:hypothetical protein